jgi:hypothetical protein
LECGGTLTIQCVSGEIRCKDETDGVVLAGKGWMLLWICVIREIRVVFRIRVYFSRGNGRETEIHVVCEWTHCVVHVLWCGCAS